MPLNILGPVETSARDKCLQTHDPIFVSYGGTDNFNGLQTLATFTADQKYAIRKITISATQVTQSLNSQSPWADIGWGNFATDIAFTGVGGAPTKAFANLSLSGSFYRVAAGGGLPALTSLYGQNAFISVDLAGCEIYLPQGKTIVLAKNQGDGFFVRYSTTLILVPTFA